VDGSRGALSVEKQRGAASFAFQVGHVMRVEQAGTVS